MRAIMGHMSQQMLERYSHIRHAAKRDAMAAVEARSAFAGSFGVPPKSPSKSDSGVVKSPVTH
jgi:hypothetical protein